MLATREYVDDAIERQAKWRDRNNEFRDERMKFMRDTMRDLEDQLQALGTYLGVVIAKSPEHYEVIKCDK